MEERKKQERRKRAKNGERNGKMLSFRCDWDVLNVLNQVENKGRFLNELVKQWARKNRRRLDKDENAWEVNPSEDEDPDEFLT